MIMKSDALITQAAVQSTYDQRLFVSRVSPAHL